MSEKQKPAASVLVPAREQETSDLTEIGPAQVDRGALHELSNSANGLNLWGYITEHELRQVLAPGYFARVRSWLAVFDRILATVNAAGQRPCHTTLIVVDMDENGPVVRRLRA